MINEGRNNNNEISKIRKKAILAEKRKRRARRKVITIIASIALCFGILKIINVFGEKNINSYDIDISKEVNSSGIPLFLQGDKRWGNLKYGKDSIKEEGCGPTCLSMVIVGLTKDSSINPKVVADYSKKAGHYDSKYGTKWTLMTEGVNEYNLISSEVPLDKDRIIQELENGNPIICSVGPGHFTTTGHFIVLKGYTEDGKFLINDPNSKEKSKKEWSYEEISNEIRGIWSFRLK